jgi:hypothetical protein
MLKHLRLLTLGMFRRPVERHRRLRLEPLESRSLLSATGLLTPSVVFRALAVHAAPNVMVNVVETAPAEVTAARSVQERPAYSAQGLHNPLALAPLAPIAPVLKSGEASIGASGFRTSPLADAQLVDGPIAKVVASNAASLTVSDADAVAGVVTISAQRFQDAFTLVATNNNVQAGSGEGQRNGWYFSTLLGLEYGAWRPEGSVPPTPQGTPNVHPSAVRSVALHALNASREFGSLEGLLLTTALAGEGECRGAGGDSQRSQSSDTTENAGVAALSAAELAEAIDLLAGGAVLSSQENLDRLTLVESGEATGDHANLETALDEALPDLISPLAKTKATPADTTDEAGYVRIGASKAWRATWSEEQYRTLRQIWQDSHSTARDAVRQAAEQASAGRLEGQALKNRLRRGSQAGDDEGMIELVVASSTETVRTLSSPQGYADGVSSIATRDVRMDEAVGQFQAFELAEGGDEGSMAPAAGGATASVAEEPSAIRAAAADEAIDAAPVQHAATAVGIVVVSMLTAVHDKRREETAAERDGQRVANGRSVRIERLS